jgi:hypothetical protein
VTYDQLASEILACVLRPGNAGANSADDHIRVFQTAVAQLPDGFFNETGALAGELAQSGQRYPPKYPAVGCGATSV